MNGFKVAVGIVLIALVGSGCSSADQQPPEPTTSESSHVLLTGEPTQKTTQDIAAATGPTIEVKGMKANLPAHWATLSPTALEAAGHPRATADTFLPTTSAPGRLFWS